MAEFHVIFAPRAQITVEKHLFFEMSKTAFLAEKSTFLCEIVQFIH